MVFIACAILCFITLFARRAVLGGELGGGQAGRIGSCIFLCLLWGIYVIMSILQAYDKAGLGGASIGGEPKLSPSIKYWLVQCDKNYNYD